jgi:hypothetical protein
VVCEAGPVIHSPHYLGATEECYSRVRDQGSGEFLMAYIVSSLWQLPNSDSLPGYRQFVSGNQAIQSKGHYGPAGYSKKSDVKASAISVHPF